MWVPRSSLAFNRGYLIFKTSNLIQGYLKVYHCDCTTLNTSGPPSLPFLQSSSSCITLKFFIFFIYIFNSLCLFRTRVRQGFSKHSLLGLVNKYSSGKTICSFSREPGIQMTKTNLPTLIITISSRHKSTWAQTQPTLVLYSMIYYVTLFVYLFLAPEWDFNLDMLRADCPKGDKVLVIKLVVELTIVFLVLVIPL